MKTIDFYLNHGHAARRRAMYISVGIGALVGGIAESLGATLEQSTAACVVAAAAMETLAIVRYAMPDRKAERATAALPIQRGRLIQAGIMLFAILVVLAVRVPGRVMAALEQQLRDASADPTLPPNGEELRRR